MMGLIDEMHERARSAASVRATSISSSSTRRIARSTRSTGAIFDYFDCLLVGLTATPKDEVDRNTYQLFDLETGVPTDVYDLDEAVQEGYLVPPTAIRVPLKFPSEGISYDDLSEEEKEAWEAQDWGDDEADPPDAVSAEAVNRWLFNEDTVDKVLETLMTHGHRVAGGDRLGKTIVFAKNRPTPTSSLAGSTPTTRNTPVASPGSSRIASSTRSR